MSDYSYQNGDQNRNAPEKGDLGYWIFTIIMLFSFTPLGVLLLVTKLFGGGRRRGRQVRGRHPYYTQQASQAPMGARTTAGAEVFQSPRQTADPAAALARRGRNMTVLGAVLTAVFGFASLMTLSESLFWLPGNLRYFLEDMIPVLSFTAGSAGLLLVGLRKRRQARRYRKYLAMVGRRQSISISALSSAMGQSPAKVREDLEDMLDDGLFPTGFLDYGGDMLVLSGDGLKDPPPAKQEAPSPSAEEGENAVLAEIQAVNNAIDNEKLSAQIDRIGLITAKIFDYQKSHPDKSPQLHSFLSYYLPTTLKILHAYARLEDQEVAGDNITAAMARIEGMMDKVVEGFEKQLDQLFQGDALDITTDVEVLERMLAKDGLSNSQGLQMGG